MAAFHFHSLERIEEEEEEETVAEDWADWSETKKKSGDKWDPTNVQMWEAKIKARRFTLLGLLYCLLKALLPRGSTYLRLDLLLRLYLMKALLSERPQYRRGGETCRASQISFALLLEQRTTMTCTRTRFLQR
jgi:hypothetical protein